MDLDKLEKILKPYLSYRLQQANNAIFVNFNQSWKEVSELPQDMRELLEKECPLEIKAEIKITKKGEAAKALIFFPDGKAAETVLLRHKDGRQTVCLSSQIGCPLQCSFCATGKLGFQRNLLAGEIISQIIFWQRFLKKEKQKVTNVVFMGMGEPLLNYNEVIKAIKIINDKDKLNIGSRHISLSTVGIIEGIKKFSQEPWQINLAFSLHAANNSLRSRLIPLNRKYPLESVFKEIKNYIKKTGRRVMIEYLLLDGINDSLEDAEELAKVLKKFLGRLFFVNLISYNPTGKFKVSTQEKTKAFKNVLAKEKIPFVQRYRFGQDIGGACGQLAGKTKLANIR